LIGLFQTLDFFPVNIKKQTPKIGALSRKLAGLFDDFFNPVFRRNFEKPLYRFCIAIFKNPDNNIIRIFFVIQFGKNSTS